MHPPHRRIRRDLAFVWREANAGLDAHPASVSLALNGEFTLLPTALG